jgi:hypothetical protein
MSQRPRSITVIGWLFVAAGAVGLVYHATEFDAQHPFAYDVLWVCGVRLLAILCGIFLLRGRNGARWGLAIWLGYHVFLSVLHTPFELFVHGLLFATVLYFLFRPRASAYFLGATRTGQNPYPSRFWKDTPPSPQPSPGRGSDTRPPSCCSCDTGCRAPERSRSHRARPC